MSAVVVGFGFVFGSFFSLLPFSFWLCTFAYIQAIFFNQVLCGRLFHEKLLLSIFMELIQFAYCNNCLSLWFDSLCHSHQTFRLFFARRRDERKKYIMCSYNGMGSNFCFQYYMYFMWPLNQRFVYTLFASSHLLADDIFSILFFAAV